MEVPPEIVIDGGLRTPRIESLVDRGIDRLEEICDYIVSVRIAIEQAQGRHLTGNAYRMRIDIRLPEHKEVVVKRSSGATKKVAGDPVDPDEKELPEEETAPGEKAVRRSEAQRRELRSEELPVLIGHTFDAATRDLQKAVEIHRREVKVHPEQETQAVIESLTPEQGYGFLRTLGGEQVYFHRNSVLHGHWEKLSIGAGVRYTAELGEKGLQASTVELVYKRGPAEIHGQMHELPETVSSKRAK